MIEQPNYCIFGSSAVSLSRTIPNCHTQTSGKHTATSGAERCGTWETDLVRGRCGSEVPWTQSGNRGSRREVSSGKRQIVEIHNHECSERTWDKSDVWVAFGWFFVVFHSNSFESAQPYHWKKNVRPRLCDLFVTLRKSSGEDVAEGPLGLGV